MGVLDDPAQFYAAPQEDWSLGDIVIVPCGVLWATAERPADTYPQPAPPPDGSRSVAYHLWLPRSTQPSFPTPMIQAWLAPAVIVADDCVLDKEFNALVDRLIREGVQEEEALARVREDDALDALVPVTPLLPYEQLRTARPEDVRRAIPIGYFPIVGSDDVDEAYIDFTRTMPVSRKLLWGPIAAMSEPARRILRWKYAQFHALRNLSVDAEIMSTVGKTITAVQVVTDNRERLVVAIELNSGESELRLRQEPRRAEIRPGHLRGRPS